MTVKLSEKQRTNVRAHVATFRSYLQSPEGKKDEAYRLKRIAFYAALDEDRLSQLDENDVEQIVSGLWASQIWKNLDYLTTKILTDNGLDHLRNEFTRLFRGTDALSARYQQFIESVKGLGPASVTEMLCYASPRSCGVWNDKARTALKILGFDDSLPLKKYRITGADLECFVATLSAIANELGEAGLPNLDLLQVDFFLYQVSGSAPDKQTVVSAAGTDFDHDEVKEKIREIGSWLGFEAETERTIGRGARVDTIWRAAIGNLGVVTYVFEVHRSGSIDSLILNLQKAVANATVQKVVAVSDTAQLEKIRREVEGLPENFRVALAYWPVESVGLVHQNLSDATDMLRQLELVKDFGESNLDF